MLENEIEEKKQRIENKKQRRIENKKKKKKLEL